LSGKAGTGAPRISGPKEAKMAEYFTRTGSEVKAAAVISVDPLGRGTYSGTQSCHRCGGAGGSEAWRHTGWTCYECAGRGKWPAVFACYSAERLAKLNATKAKADARREAKRAAEVAAKLAVKRSGFDAWIAQNGPAVGNLALVSGDPFIDEMSAKVRDGQTLSDRQLDTAVMSVVRKLAQQDERQSSRHVGEVGKRIEIDFKVDKVHAFESSYGYPRIVTYINIGRDGDGNRVVYKGSRSLESGRYRFTVKEHDERDGELQTIVARPVDLDVPVQA
jgi:hypothetical protein